MQVKNRQNYYTRRRQKMTSKIRSRKNLQEDLLKRSQESYDKKDETGRFGTYFKAKSELNDMEFWKCSEAEHQIDIIPWLAGNNYPSKSYDIKEGDIAIVLDLWIHYNVGPNEDSVVCPARNYSNPCPICEHVNELRKEEDSDDDVIKEKLPKRRSVYQIVCYDSNEEESKGVQIWEVSHYFMERHLTELSQKPKRGGFIPYADPDEGKQIYFKRKGQGQFNTEYMAHQFLDRDYVIDDDILDMAIPLDEAIIVLNYEELKNKYWGGSEEEATDPDDEAKPEAKPSRRARVPVKEEQKKPESSPTEDKDKETPPEDKPASRRRVRQQQQQKEQKPQEEEKKPEPEGECPAGGVFGVDLDNPLDECDDCKVWDDCAREANRLEKQG
jgi:hypothetical protein